MSSSIGPPQLKWMQATTERFLPDTMAVYLPPDPNTASRGVYGQIKEAFTSWTLLATYACRVDGLPIKRLTLEQVGAGQVQSDAYYEITFTANSRVTERCRLKITASPNNPDIVGRVFDIFEITETSLPTLNVARCTFIRPTAVNQ